MRDLCVAAMVPFLMLAVSFGSFEVPGASEGSASLTSRRVAVAGNQRGAGTRQRGVSTEKEAVRREAAREGTWHRANRRREYARRKARSENEPAEVWCLNMAQSAAVIARRRG